MRFSEIIGNDALKAQLMRMVRGNRLGHAILFTEENGGGGFAFALALAQFVNCREPQESDSCGTCPSCHKYQKLIHPDLHFVFPVSSSNALSESEKKGPISDYFLPAFRELALANPYFTEQALYDAIGIENKSGLISVNEAKRIFEKLSLRAAEGLWKTMIIYLPEKMNLEAANKLLKLLEEPPQGTLFLLVAHNPERLLSTIRSRCQLIALKPLSREERRRTAGGRDGDNAEFREITRSRAWKNASSTPSSNGRCSPTSAGRSNANGVSTRRIISAKYIWWPTTSTIWPTSPNRKGPSSATWPPASSPPSMRRHSRRSNPPCRPWEATSIPSWHSAT